MKFLHLGDLHLGKRVYGYSMLDDQRFALEQVVRMAAITIPVNAWTLARRCCPSRACT